MGAEVGSARTRTQTKSTIVLDPKHDDKVILTFSIDVLAVALHADRKAAIKAAKKSAAKFIDDEFENISTRS